MTVNFNDVFNPQTAQQPCGLYDREHDFNEFVDYEERGVLVITHGQRAGRIYTVEKSWRERECKKCQVTDRRTTHEVGAEWPNTVR